MNRDFQRAWVLSGRTAFMIAAGAVSWSGCGSIQTKNPWLKAMSPTKSSPESIGSCSAGCLRGAVPMELSVEGVELMRPSRRRFYGHPRLVQYLRNLGRKVSEANLGALLVGDLGLPRGGPTSSTHLSHQSGLDVDVWYRQIPKGSALSKKEREEIESPPMVTPDFARLNKDWNPNEIEILKLAASEPEVDRIFINPVIKRKMCQVYKGEPWMARLRPWWDHDDHFHVRLTCPESDKRCGSKMDPLPPGDGCDDTLESWFTPEKKAKEKRLREDTTPSPMPVLPPECREVLTEK